MPAIDWNRADDEWATAVVLHPHPDMGGDRHNHVVEAFFRALPSAGVTAARFDFSSSDPTVARGEVLDVLAQADGRLFVVGYSFGADIATTVGDARIAAWVLVAPPLRLVDPAAMVVGHDPRPKLVLPAERDQFSSPDHARAVTADWAATTIQVLGGADHFLAGATGAAVEQALTWLPRS